MFTSMAVNNINNKDYFNVGLAQISHRQASIADSGATLPSDLSSPNPALETEISLKINKFTQIRSFDTVLSKKLSPEGAIDPSSLLPNHFYNSLHSLLDTFEGKSQPELSALHAVLKKNADNVDELRTRYLSLLGG